MAQKDSKRKEQRSKTFVDKAVQGKFLRRVLAHWVIYLFCSSVLAVIFKWLTDPFQPFETVASTFVVSHAATLIMALLLLPVFARDTLHVTHKFAGPMVRIRRAMNDLAVGRHVERIQFRPGDFWHHVAEEFNDMCDRLEPVLASGPEAAVTRKA